MNLRQPTATIAAALLLFSGVPAQDEEPRSLDLLERTGSRLAQLDVTATGPKGHVDDLTAADFELRVGGRFIEEFVVDRVCRAPDPVPGQPAPAPAAPAPAEFVQTAGPPATFVFYFDQPHLTMAGRQESIDLAHELIPELLDGDAQAMIVSAARKLEVVQDMTSDPERLAAGLDRLQRNREQWSTWAMEEDLRVRQLAETLQDDMKNAEQALALARMHQRAEIWEAEKSLHRVHMVLGRLAELDPPKAFLYFADTMRKNPGEHYLSYFGRQMINDPNFAGSTLSTSATLSGNAMDRIINAASALGIRFYTVQGAGLVSETMTSAWSGPDATAARPNMVRVRDAQDTLAGLARETGGAWFLNGVRANRIVDRIREDLSCLYLVSFSPEGFDEDTPLPVRLTTSRKKVTIQTRGRLVIQSDSARQTARLLSTFATASEATADRRITGVVIPTGYEDGLFSALVQITVPGSNVRGTTWDLGASLVTEEKVRADASGRVLAATPGVRVVFEEEMRFPPGPFELVAVGHEITTDQVVSRKLEGNWPNPNRMPVTLSPVVVLQPDSAAFLRDGVLREEGPLGFLEREPLSSARPTALVGLVCRSKGNRNRLVVQRTLGGDTEASFPPLEFEPGGDRCVQYRDVVPPDVMTEGEFRFQVAVVEKGEILATTERTFAVLDGREPMAEKVTDER